VRVQNIYCSRSIVENCLLAACFILSTAYTSIVIIPVSINGTCSIICPLGFIAEVGP
jgi:hypothetical protein